MANRWIGKLLSLFGLTPAKRAPSVGKHRTAGDQARDAGDWHRAVTQYRLHLTQSPGDFAIWVQLGHASKETGDPESAEQAYRRAEAISPRDPDLLLHLGHLMKTRKRPDDAAALFQRSFNADGNQAARRELGNLGIIATVQGDAMPIIAEAGRGGAIPAAMPIHVLDPNRPLELRGSQVTGWVRHTATPEETVLITLFEDGIELGRTFGDGPHDGRYGFSIPLPVAMFDGRAHVFVIKANDHLAANFVTMTPFQATPDALLADYATHDMRARLSDIAAWRYAALDEHVARAARGQGDDMATIAATHRYLVEGPTRAGLADVYAPFAFPDMPAPVVSVVVPVHNSFDYTYRCLASLRAMPVDLAFEVIVVDDGSSDRTTDLAGLLGGIRIVRHDVAQGFVGACNAGGTVARGEYVVLLNNDTEVSPHWIDHLIAPFDLYDDVGLVGGKLLFADGRLQEAGGVVWRDGRASNFGRLGNPREPRFNYLRETDYCSGACMAVPRTLWIELGGFDLAFKPAYYEDTDFAFRVRASGKRVLYQPRCEILHFEGVSNGIDTAAGMKRHQIVNQPKFLERWSDTLRANGKSGTEDALAIERTYPRRVLVIDSEVPQPDRSAGHHAAVQEMRLLQSLGYRVVFLPENLAFLGRYNAMLGLMGIEAIHAPFHTSAEQFLIERGGEFDLVYVTRYTVAQAILPLIAQYCPEAKIVFNNADLHFLRELRDSIDTIDDAAREHAIAVRDQELAVMRTVDLTLSYSDVEHAVIQSHTMGAAHVAKCPWVIEPRPRGPGFDDRADIAFLGGYRHPPNVRAVEFFVREVMPILRQTMPGVRLRLYGSYPPPSFKALEAEDVIVEGFIDRVEDALDRARLFVAPLLTGAGIKGKVLEALASGVPSVLSPIAAEGVGLRHGLEADIVTTPAEWAASIARLYEDRDAWQRMSDAAIAFVAANYGFDSARETMKRGFADRGIATLSGMTCRRLPL